MQLVSDQAVAENLEYRLQLLHRRTVKSQRLRPPSLGLASERRRACVNFEILAVLLCLLALAVLGLICVVRVYAQHWATRPGGNEEREFLETLRDDK